jgi:hypothetical protein
VKTWFFRFCCQPISGRDIIHPPKFPLQPINSCISLTKKAKHSRIAPTKNHSISTKRAIKICKNQSTGLRYIAPNYGSINGLLKICPLFIVGQNDKYYQESMHLYFIKTPLPFPLK